MLGRAATKASTLRPETPETPQRPLSTQEIEDYRRDGVLGWDLEAGDLVAFHPLTLHGSEGNTSATDRAAIAFRFTGDDVTYHPTPYTFPIFFPHGRRVGETMGGPTFPQVLPQTIPEECARRDRRAEIPSPLELARFLARPITRTFREFRQRSLETANR